MIGLSPGVASGCFNVLQLAERHPMPFARMASELPRHGGVDVAVLVELSQELNWLRANDSGIAVLTPRGERILTAPTEPLKLRRALLDYVEIAMPPWIKMATDGRKKVLSFAPSGVAQCLVEAELAVGYAQEVVEFWDQLAATARGLRDVELNQTGREGERLTLSFERVRTGCEPRWRSIESNADGYDVLSVAARDDGRPVQIEVKASSIGLGGVLHLTRNEWEAAETMPLHTFHLWDVSRDGFPALAIVRRSEVVEHVPADRCNGRWAEVQIPFAAFSGSFNAVTVR